MTVDIKTLFTFSNLTCANSNIDKCKIDNYTGTNSATNIGTVW